MRHGTRAKAFTLLCLLAGCATATAARSPVTGLGGSADGPELARQALARWSTDADPAAADALLDAAAHKDPHDPLVELGRLLLARRRLDDRTELQQALELIERHPERPEARIASASLERLAGTSTTLDQGLLLGVAGADLERADPVVAQRLRDIQ